MALAFADAAPQNVADEPFTVTSNTVTVTLDGTATSGAFAGIAHGGPTGRAPFAVTLGEALTASTTDGVNVARLVWTATDTVNDEVDVTIVVDGSGTNTETCTFSVLCWFLPAAADVGRTAPVGYTAPSNANF